MANRTFTPNPTHNRSVKRAGRPWTPKELDFLANNYGNIPTERIARRYNRTAKAVRRQAEKQGLTRS